MAARSRYLAARQTYSRVKVAADNFGIALLPGVTNLDSQIDPGRSPADRGLPRLADGLWSSRTQGLPAVAAALVADIDRLADRFGSMHLDAVSIGAGTAGALGDVVTLDLVARSGTAPQLGLIESLGVVEGSQAVLSSMGGPLRHRDAALAATVSARLADVEQQLAGLRMASGFPSTDAIAPTALRRLAVGVDAAADAYSQVAAALTRPAGP